MPETDSAWIAINAIRALAMDAVEQAQSGHPGTPMALAPAAYVLWTRFLKHDPRNPDWPDRDRFVLSCGHASMLQYALLHLSGYDLPLDDIRHFRQWGSRTPGHPERGHTPGVETTTGPLGPGRRQRRRHGDRRAAPGRAVQSARARHRGPRVWAFVSDGDLMEGVASEAASLAGHLRLDKLTLIYDDNHITIDGSTSLTFSEDVGRRFEAYGWHVERVGGDGNDLDAIAAATRCRVPRRRPPLPGDPPHPHRRPRPDQARQRRGAWRAARRRRGSPHQGDHGLADGAAHSTSPTPPTTRGARPRRPVRKREAAWRERLARYRTEHAADAAEFTRRVAGELPAGWEARPAGHPGRQGARDPAGLRAGADSALAGVLPELAGGSADLAGSTGTQLKQVGTLGPASTGREIHWGVREHGMAAALNGIAAHGGVRPFGSTFLVFTDYMKPAIRLAALMKLPVIYVGTHDSIGLGEDGPTHQPVEQLAMLRAIPGMLVLRPADATETVEAWRAAIRHRTGPVVLVLTRQKLPVLDRARLASADGVTPRRVRVVGSARRAPRPS